MLKLFFLCRTSRVKNKIIDVCPTKTSAGLKMVVVGAEGSGDGGKGLVEVRVISLLDEGEVPDKMLE